MRTVERVRIGDVLRLERRQVEVDVSVEYEEIGVRSFGRGIFHKEPVTGATLGNKRVFRIEADDLVISNVFAWEGAIAVASEAEVGKIGSHRFMTFVPIDGRIDPTWAAWYLGSEPGLEQIRKASPGSAGRNKTLAVKRFAELSIPLPPIGEQRRCASVLDRASEHANAVTAALVERGPDAVIATLPALIDEVVRQHASGRAAVGELVDLVSDIVHPGDDLGDADSFVGLQHVARHTGLRVGADAVEAMKGRKFRFAPGDLVYGYLRPYLNKVWVADRHGLCSVDQYVLRPRSTVDAELLAHVLRGQTVLDRAIELTHSLQLPRLRSGLLMSLEVPVIADTAATEVTRRLDEIRDRVVEIATARQAQLRTAEALMPAALNQAFGSR